MNKAYSVLAIKSFDDDARTFTGIASTPETDRQGDIVDPKGVKFKLPLIFLYQHDTKKPIGNITTAVLKEDGIHVGGYVEKADGDEPESWKERVNVAWTDIKKNLVRGLSIGFRGIQEEPIKTGTLYKVWEWLELSAVTIPANASASIQTIKSIDQAQERSASGAAPVVRLDPSPPGASGSQTKPASSRFFYDPSKGKNMKTYREQIEGFEAKRAANVGRQQELVQKAADEGRTFDPSEKEEYAALKSDVSAIDEQLVVLREMELTSKQTAQTVNGTTADVSSEQARNGAAGNGKPAGVVTTGKSNLPKGTGFVRLAMLTMASNGDDQKALNMAKRFRDSTPEVENIFRAKIEGLELKAAVAAGTTTDATWAAPLVQYQQLASEFVELLRPETVLGKIGGFRRVPFNVRIPSQSTGVSAGWVGQGAPKPVGKPGFTSATMDFYKIAIIVAMTEELVRFSNPAAEGLVRSDMINAIAQFMDEQFLSPGVAAVAGVSPASITFGLTPVQSSGVTVAAITADMKALFAKFTAANISLDGITLIMHPNNALSLAMARTSQDVPAFPGMSIAGGGFLGVTVITSASVPSSTSGGSMVIALKPSEIFLADDGQVTIDMSREASVQMDSAPAAGAQSLTSFWQNNLVGLRAERYINYARRRTGAVAYIDNVGW